MYSPIVHIEFHASALESAEDTSSASGPPQPIPVRHVVVRVRRNYQSVFPGMDEDQNNGFAKVPEHLVQFRTLETITVETLHLDDSVEIADRIASVRNKLKRRTFASSKILASRAVASEPDNLTTGTTEHSSEEDGDILHGPPSPFWRLEGFGGSRSTW